MKDVIVLDIGTQFIKASVSGNNKFFVQEICTKDILTSCKKAIKKIQKKSKTKTREIFLGLNSDTLNGKTTTICFKRENPCEPIDLIELKNLIQKIEWRALDNIRREFFKETELKNSDIKLVSPYLIDIKIDEQSNLNPIGLLGENISISVYNTYTCLKNFNSLEKLATDLKLNLTGMVPIAFALFNYFDFKNQQRNNALIIDIGGKTTEITLIQNKGETIETKSFHLGGRTFSRVLAEFLNSSWESGELVKIKYCNNEISNGAKRKIEKILQPSTSLWFNGVKVILSDFLKNYKFIPDKIFVCGGGANIPPIESYFKKEKKIKVLNFGNKNNLSEISCLALKKIYKELPDEKNIFAPIFKRVIKLIQS